MKVIKYAILAISDEATGEMIQAFVQECNVDAHGGRGAVLLTYDIHQAKHFSSVMEAMEFWKRQSNVLPIRPDGKPNRPLTAYTVTLERVPHENKN